MNTGGLKEFKDVLKSFRELGGLAIKGAVALPLLNIWSKLGPPPATAIAVLTSAIQFLSVMWTFHFWAPLPRKVLDTRMKLAAAVFCTALIATSVLMERFTVRPAPGHQSVVLGYQLRPDVQPLVKATYTPMDALHDVEYDPARVWTEGSIIAVHVILTVCWLLTFVSISVFASTFLIQHKSARPGGQSAARGKAALGKSRV
jgi:hypothetical protein